MDAATREATETSSARVWLRPLLLWALPLAALAAAVVLYGLSGRYVSTDNAYLQQDRVDVASQLSAEVRQVLVAENERVSAGQPVLVLDDTVPRIAVAAAESRLSAARTEVRAALAGWREKAGELAVANSTSAYASREFDRQRQLAARGLTPVTQLDTAHRSSDLAVGAIEVLKLQLEQAQARLGGDPRRPLDAYSQVRYAKAELDRAEVDLERTRIRAPQAGIVSHLPKVGSRLEAGRAAFAVVVERRLWVEANFKETDLEWVRPGQRAEIEIDTYPEHVWVGRVESLSQATGAEFALLPAQNASGNWVKVVQRIAVRIAVEAAADGPPLRDGMSATVEIDTGKHRRFDRWFGRTATPGR